MITFKRKPAFLLSLFLLSTPTLFSGVANALPIDPIDIRSPENPDATEPDPKPVGEGEEPLKALYSEWSYATDNHYVQSNIEYCPRGTETTGPLGSLHVPKSFYTDDEDKTYPAVVFFHGTGGNADNQFAKTILANLAEQGFVGFSADYKESPLSKITFNALLNTPIGELLDIFIEESDPSKVVHDAFIQAAAEGRCAVRWVKRLAEGSNPLRIDPNRVAVSGWSLGTMVAQNVAFSTPESFNVCVNDSSGTEIKTASSWRIFLHRSQRHAITVEDNDMCTFAISANDWQAISTLIEPTEAQWQGQDTPDGVQAFVPISTTSDLLTVGSECGIMHSDFGNHHKPVLPMPVSSNGASKCQRYKHAQEAHNILLPANLVDGDLFEHSWRTNAESMMWQGGDSFASFLIDQDSGNVPGNAETIVPYEKHMLPAVRSWLEKLSPIDALPPIASDASQPATSRDAITAAIQPPAPIPTLIVAGGDDAGPIWQEQIALGVRLHAAGFPVETVVVAGAGHDVGDETNDKKARDYLIGDFLNSALETTESAPELDTFYEDLCTQKQISFENTTKSITCMDDRSTVNKPFIFPVTTASHVAPKHHLEKDGEFPFRVAPLNASGNYDAVGGRYSLYSGMAYVFAGLEFDRTETGYDNFSEDIIWSIDGVADTWSVVAGNEDGECVGSSIALTVGNATKPKSTDYSKTCYFNVQPGNSYTLTATSAADLTTTTHANIDTSAHPYGGVHGARIIYHSRFWGLIKWHELRWSDFTGYANPGGRVDIFVDGSSSPSVSANQSSLSVFWTRAKSQYKVCYTGTQTCSIIKV